MTLIERLKKLSSQCGKPLSKGLDEETITQFASRDPKLSIAVDYAEKAMHHLSDDEREWLKKDEKDLIDFLQDDYINFYAKETVEPFVALSAYGPWIITAYGAVLHDSGGYGMLGAGHNPENVAKVIAEPYVMANIMTPTFIQKKFTNTLRNNIGFNRSGSLRHPFVKFICLNSGSESVTMALRFSDLNANIQTGPGGKHKGKKIKILAMEGAFHGRTDRPAQASDSCLAKYKKYLASFRDRDNLITIPSNDSEKLANVWNHANSHNEFIEAVMMEPIMGEGRPGYAVTPEYFSLARKLTIENDSVLIVDSIQAAIRGHGCLSITDYPGFEELDGPDLETYSKALNAGQYPLSVLGIGHRMKDLYKTGIYGNTMTTNPRALEVACTVMENITPELRRNITMRGEEFLRKLEKVNSESGNIIKKIEGTGLLFAAHFEPSTHPVIGENGLETQMRKVGVNVIHGGENALRFTPHFAITSEEVDLVINTLKKVLDNHHQSRKAG